MLEAMFTKTNYAAQFTCQGPNYHALVKKNMGN